MFTIRNTTVVFEQHLALEVEELTLRAGELVGLVGSNGSGKTTLLKLLAGLLKPQSGLVHREDVRVSYVAQEQDHHPWMRLTVDEVLRTGRYHEHRFLGRFTEDDLAIIDACASRLDVTGLRGRSFGELSVGQRQRVLIATALAIEAPCLLLDEPTAGLDLASREVIAEVVHQERAAGCLVVMSTHHLAEAMICDRVVLLDTHVVANGTPADVLATLDSNNSDVSVSEAIRRS